MIIPNKIPICPYVVDLEFFIGYKMMTNVPYVTVLIVRLSYGARNDLSYTTYSPFQKNIYRDRRQDVAQEMEEN